MEMTCYSTVPHDICLNNKQNARYRPEDVGYPALPPAPPTLRVSIWVRVRSKLTEVDEMKKASGLHDPFSTPIWHKKTQLASTMSIAAFQERPSTPENPVITSPSSRQSIIAHRPRNHTSTDTMKQYMLKPTVATMPNTKPTSFSTAKIIGPACPGCRKDTGLLILLLLYGRRTSVEMHGLRQKAKRDGCLAGQIETIGFGMEVVRSHV